MSNYQGLAQKLQTKYLQDEEFQIEVDERFKKYQILLQQSLYADLSSVSQDLFVCYNQGVHPIYFYFGMLQNTKKENSHKLAMYFIKFFNRKPIQDYTFVFLNTRASSEAYGLFKEIFLQLTIDHFLHLKEFILVRPTYYQRAQDYISFSVFPNYLRNLTKYVYSGEELCEYLEINPQDFVDIVPMEISNEEFPKLKPRKLTLVDQRINFQGQLQDQEERAQRKQFQSVMKSMLIIKPGKQTHHLHDYEVNKFGIPVILGVLIFYFKTHPEGLKEQGLFRKSVSIDEETQTLGELINKNYNCLLTITNPHIIANLIKRFFSNLKVPVFPYKQFGQLMHDQGVRDKKQQIKNVVKTLPQLNSLCLMFLIQFLNEDVISNVSYNKMSAQNIAICFAPCLMRAEKASEADIIYASKCAIVTRLLLDNFQFIFGNKIARERKYRVSEDNITKQFEMEMKQNIQAEKSQRSSRSKSSRSSVSSLTKSKSLDMNNFKLTNPLRSNTPKNEAKGHFVNQNIGQKDFDHQNLPSPHYPPHYTFGTKVPSQFNLNAQKQRQTTADKMQCPQLLINQKQMQQQKKLQSNNQMLVKNQIISIISQSDEADSPPTEAKMDEQNIQANKCDENNGKSLKGCKRQSDEFKLLTNDLEGEDKHSNILC